MSEKKNSSYISARDSRRITRFNRRVTKKLEKDRANANKDPKLYTTKMRDENNVVEFDNVCTYFFTDVGTVKANASANSKPRNTFPGAAKIEASSFACQPSQTANLAESNCARPIQVATNTSRLRSQSKRDSTA